MKSDPHSGTKSLHDTDTRACPAIRREGGLAWTPTRRVTSYHGVDLRVGDARSHPPSAPSDVDPAEPTPVVAGTQMMDF